MYKFHERLHEIRRKYNWTYMNVQLLYEHDCNQWISVRQYKAWEAGREYPPLPFVSWFCKRLGISSDYLLGLTDSITLSSPSTRNSAAITSDLLNQLDIDLRSKVDGYIDCMLALQRERLSPINKQEV